MTSREKKDNAIAAGVTMISALILLLILFFGTMPEGRSLLAAESTPEPPEDEITFLEPELDLLDPGEREVKEDVESDPPVPKGEPDPAPVPEETKERVEPGKAPEPRPVVDRPAVQKKPSPVKVPENTVSDADSKRIRSMEGKFTAKNGSAQGKNTPVNGQGSARASGSVSGRKFLGCTTGTVELRQEVTVVVRVTVNAAGKVTSAKASRGPKEFWSKCEAWARSARWSAKEGAPDASGTLTFTITPK